MRDEKFASDVSVEQEGKEEEEDGGGKCEPPVTFYKHSEAATMLGNT
jgi:hypothetical protein